MTGRVPSSMRDTLLRLLIAVGEGRGEEVADRALEMGERREGFDENEFRRRVSAVVSDFAQTRLADLQIGLVLISVSRVAGETGHPDSARAVDARQDALEPRRDRQGARSRPSTRPHRSAARRRTCCGGG